jgi:hypothetical protein
MTLNVTHAEHTGLMCELEAEGEDKGEDKLDERLGRMVE